MKNILANDRNASPAHKIAKPKQKLIHLSIFIPLLFDQIHNNQMGDLQLFLVDIYTLHNLQDLIIGALSLGFSIVLYLRQYGYQSTSVSSPDM